MTSEYLSLISHFQVECGLFSDLLVPGVSCKKLPCAFVFLSIFETLSKVSRVSCASINVKVAEMALRKTRTTLFHLNYISKRVWANYKELFKVLIQNNRDKFSLFKKWRPSQKSDSNLTPN